MSKEELFKKTQDCRECSFWDWEINVLNEEMGYGKYGCFSYSDKADIMIIGQNPSRNRFMQPLNHSLSGKQGDLFREIFGKNRLILNNLVKISTPDNKILDSDAEHGYLHLLEDIETYRPKLIIGLGSYVTRILRKNFIELNEFTKNFPEMKAIRFLRHPDFYLSYNPSGLPDYKKQIESIKTAYLQM